MTGRVDLGVGGRIVFAHRELGCPQSGVVRLATGFADHLTNLRSAFGHPMRVTSCCRSAAHNQAVGGHPRSLHVCDKPHHGLGGAAAIDVYSADASYAPALVRLALEHGWSVGVSRNFIHLDRRDLAGLPPAVFGY